MSNNADGISNDKYVDRMLDILPRIVYYRKRNFDGTLSHIYGVQIDKNHILEVIDYNKYSDINAPIKIPIKGFRKMISHKNIVGFYHVIEKMKTMNKKQINKYVQSDEYKRAIIYYTKLAKYKSYYSNLCNLRKSELYYYTDFINSFEMCLKIGHTVSNYREHLHKYLHPLKNRKRILEICKENRKLKKENWILKVKPILDKHLIPVLANIVFSYY